VSESKKTLLDRFKEISAMENQAHDFYFANLEKITREDISRPIKKIAEDELRHAAVADELVSIAEKIGEDKEKISAVYSETLERLETELGNLDSPCSILLLTTVESYAKASFGLTEYSHKKGKKILYFAVNKSGSKVKELMGEAGGDVSGVTFIDSNTVNEQGQIVDVKNLSEFAINIEKAESKNLFVILDSLAALSTYHDQKTIEKFIHSIISQGGRNNFCVAFIAVDSGEGDTAHKAAIASCFDKVINI